MKFVEVGWLELCVTGRGWVGRCLGGLAVFCLVQCFCRKMTGHKNHWKL